MAEYRDLHDILERLRNEKGMTVHVDCYGNWFFIDNKGQRSVLFNGDCFPLKEMLEVIDRLLWLSWEPGLLPMSL